jgi:hypothetical protein
MEFVILGVFAVSLTFGALYYGAYVNTDDSEEFQEHLEANVRKLGRALGSIFLAVGISAMAGLAFVAAGALPYLALIEPGETPFGFVGALTISVGTVSVGVLLSAVVVRLIVKL